MSNLPTLSVFGTVSDVVDDLFVVCWNELEASGTLHYFRIMGYRMGLKWIWVTFHQCNGGRTR